MGIFQKIKDGLKKTHQKIWHGISTVILRRSSLDDACLEDIEKTLIEADLGVSLAGEVCEELRAIAHTLAPAQVPGAVKAIMCAQLKQSKKVTLFESTDKPTVVLVLGVNGTGKTTTIAKLTYHLMAAHKKVMLAAADTFRAAAIDQLKIWAERLGAPIICHQQGADPSAVMYDALDAACHRGMDYLIVDTAGRLHNKTHLMEELKKISRTVQKKHGRNPDEVLLVLDGSTGQNAVTQAHAFHEAVGITGLVVTKLDGTAKGGIVLAINKEFGIPIKYIGVGEQLDDLQEFDPSQFVDALFYEETVTP